MERDGVSRIDNGVCSTEGAANDGAEAVPVVMRKMKQSVAISDHAIVRWLERRHGISRAEILSEIFGEAIPKQLPQGRYQRGDVWIVVEDNCIITVLEDAEKKRREGLKTKTARFVERKNARADK